ncbi:MAG: UDP-N-acetylglucosamine 2-epimerase (non-hydrolyzing) [bacterium]
MKILHVVGARPNFPKLAPVHRAGVARKIEQVIVHTGQHYDEALSASFFASLGIPQPDFNLTVGSGSHALQTARIMERLEPVLLEQRPDWVVVYGDVNSTLAAAVVASKIGQRVAHVEAGLRSGDRTMPEEINRLVTDRLASLLLTPSRDADERLREEGEPDDEIVFVGNVMVDTLLRAVKLSGLERPAQLTSDAPIAVTLHRPSNVDDVERLALIMQSLREVALSRPVIFPAHPRTSAKLAAAGISMDGIDLRGPVQYEEMLALITRSAAVITDSGGLQEETTVLGIPCFTLRDNTERPVTITEGTNQLVRDMTLIPSLIATLDASPARKRVPEGWDGNAGPRIIEALLNAL